MHDLDHPDSSWSSTFPEQPSPSSQQSMYSLICVQILPVGEPLEDLLDDITATVSTANPTSFPQRASLLNALLIDSVSCHVENATKFWADTILTDHPGPEQLISWLHGVHLDEYFDPNATGAFQGRQYDGNNLTPIELPNNVTSEFDNWLAGIFLIYKTKATPCHVRKSPMPPTLHGFVSPCRWGQNPNNHCCFGTADNSTLC